MENAEGTVRLCSGRAWWRGLSCRHSFLPKDVCLCTSGTTQARRDDLTMRVENCPSSPGWTFDRLSGDVLGVVSRRPTAAIMAGLGRRASVVLAPLHCVSSSRQTVKQARPLDPVGTPITKSHGSLAAVMIASGLVIRWTVTPSDMFATDK